MNVGEYGEYSVIFLNIPKVYMEHVDSMWPNANMVK